MKKMIGQTIKKTIKVILYRNANSTTSINMYQPKLPKGFSKIKKNAK